MTEIDEGQHLPRTVHCRERPAMAARGQYSSRGRRGNLSWPWTASIGFGSQETHSTPSILATMVSDGYVRAWMR